MKWMLLTVLTTMNVWAISSAPNVQCPVQFEGIAEHVQDEAGPDHSLAKQIIEFRPTQVIVGEVGAFVQVASLKYGPTQVEEGTKYRVHLKDGRLCKLENL